MAFVSSIANLRITTTTDAFVLVGSYYDPGSGPVIIKNGGGLFVYDVNATSSDDSGTIIIDGMNRRWKRQVEGSLTPAMFGARGDGTTIDTIAWQSVINYAETMLNETLPSHVGQSNVVIDGQGLVYAIDNELKHEQGIGLVICNARFLAVDLSPPATSKWSITPYTAAQIPDLIRTNSVLWNRDLTDSDIWPRSNMTTVSGEEGIDGDNSATKLSATAANATIMQNLTASSGLRVQTAFVKRVTGSGNIEMTMDGGLTYSIIEPVLTNYKQFRIPEQTFTGTQPQVGFRIGTSGNKILVDFVQNEGADGIPVSSPPMATTMAPVTRVVPSTYMLRITSGAQSPIIQTVRFDCNNLCGGIYFAAFSTQIEHCRFDEVAGIGIRQEAGGARVSFNLISQYQLPDKRGGIGIYSAHPDGKFIGNIARYLAWPFYFGQNAAMDDTWGATGLWIGNHAYNGDASFPDSGIMYFGTGSNSNNFVGGYLDNGGIHIRNTDQSFWNNRASWTKTNAKALFAFWASDPEKTTLNNWNFGGLEYSDLLLTAAGATVWAFRVTGSGTWDGINKAKIQTLAGGARFDDQRQEYVSNNDDLPKFFGKGVSAFMALYAKETTTPPEIGVTGNNFYIKTNSVARLALDQFGVSKWIQDNDEVPDIQYRIQANNLISATDHLEGSRTADGSAYAQTDYDNRGNNSYNEAGSTIAATASLRAYRDGKDDSAMFRMTLSIGGNMVNAFKFSQNGMGYAVGMGDTVTQLTSKSTAVLLDKPTGAITLHAASLAAGTIVSFVMTNSTVAATDVLILNHISGGTPGSYTLNARAAVGSATINVRNNTAAALAEAIVIRFALIKSVNT